MPIKQIKEQDDLSKVHSDADRLTLNGGTLETTGSFTLNSNRGITLSGNGTINTGSGTVAYAGVIAGSNNGIVVGTGNKVEDLGRFLH